MEDVKALGEKFVRVCVSVIVHLARGIRLRSVRGAGADAPLAAADVLCEGICLCSALSKSVCTILYINTVGN